MTLICKPKKKINKLANKNFKNYLISFYKNKFSSKSYYCTIVICGFKSFKKSISIHFMINQLIAYL